MMSLLFLTIFLCLSFAEFYNNVGENSYVPNNYADEPPYNIHEWIQHLQLQTCALVAIGLKYFAIFVENIEYSNGTTLKSSKYFIGMCHQSTLESWEFCSPDLAKKRKYKCRFKMKPGMYHLRVHRRFCDIKVMVNNKDCICETTLEGEEMFKVRGFPTCYISPLPYTLCKYNVCGLYSCEGLTENALHTVQCNPKCVAGNPFCEGPLYRSSKPPEINSVWSKWRQELDSAADGESPANTMKTNGKNRRSVATCINKYTGKPDLDCLGPGTGCCPDGVKDCSCNTYQENGVLKLERNIYIENEENMKDKRHHVKKLLQKKKYRFPFRRKKSLRQNYRFSRDTDDDIEDDDENENSDLDEDIVLEEDSAVVPIHTTQSCMPCEKEEIDTNVKLNIAEEKIIMKNNNTLSNLGRNNGWIIEISILLILLVVNLFLLSKLLFI